MRLALGVSRARLLSQLLTESIVLALAGGAALVVGLLTGLAPMLQASRANASLTADLKAGTREGTLSGSSTRAVLLVIQAALSVVLLVGEGCSCAASPTCAACDSVTTSIR